MRQPFLILETGRPIASMRRHGGFVHWIRVAAGLERDDAVVVNVEGRRTAASREGFAGAIVTGSGAMVTDRADWSGAERAVVARPAAHAGMPLLGICYGPPVARARAGRGRGLPPDGRRWARSRSTCIRRPRTIRCSPACRSDFPAQATHLQSVLRPPAGATVLARSLLTPAMPSAGANARGLQFHLLSSAPPHARLH